MDTYRRQFSLFSKQLGALVGLLLVVFAHSTLNADTSKRILFFGDSLTAGYGIDSEQAYPALIQQKIDNAGIHAQVVVDAVSGDTSAGGLRRIDEALRQPVDIFVLALGANDGLRGVDTRDTRNNLQAIIDKVWSKYPESKIIIAGMQMPPSLGQTYAEAFTAIYPQLTEDNEVTLIPFLLKNVGGEPGLNQSDRIHPNTAGHKLLAETVWSSLDPVLTQAIADQTISQNEDKHPLDAKNESKTKSEASSRSKPKAIFENENFGCWRTDL
jgi:acyl-CoA thioesterase-1